MWLTAHSNMNGATVSSSLNFLLVIDIYRKFLRGTTMSKYCFVNTKTMSFPGHICTIFVIAHNLNISLKLPPSRRIRPQSKLQVSMTTNLKNKHSYKGHQWIPFGVEDHQYSFIIIYLNASEIGTKQRVDMVIKPFHWNIWILLILSSCAISNIFTYQKSIKHDSNFFQRVRQYWFEFSSLLLDQPATDRAILNVKPVSISVWLL